MVIENYKKEELKLLYVDNKPEELEQFSTAFKGEYNVFCCQSVSDAFNILNEHGEIPVVIADQRMPDMKGFEFLERILLDHEDSVGIILTPQTDIKEMIEGCNETTECRYVIKPSDKREFCCVLRDSFNS